MPDYTLLKSVNDPSMLLDGFNKWKAAGRDPAKLFLDYRHWAFVYPNWDTNPDWNTLVALWRRNFAKFVDATYLQNYATVIKYVEELNEYTDTRMVTDKSLLAPRLRSAQAAAWVWNNEYRGKNGIGSDTRLVVCNSPVGNDIPVEYFKLCKDEDCVLGVRTYTHWTNGTRDPLDFRYHSGRPFYNEQQYGIKVDYILGETGPYDGSAPGGWRSSSCMGGDANKLVAGMVAWWNDLATTNAYKEGRIKGPGAWFTTNRSDAGEWKHFLLWTGELTILADECKKVWKPGQGGTTPPPPPPPAASWQEDLWNVSVSKQAISLNASALLQRAIFAANFVPVQSEFRHTRADNVVVAAQAAEQLSTGERRVYWTPVPAAGQSWQWPQWFIDPKKKLDINVVVDALPKHQTKTYDARPESAIKYIVVHHTVSTATPEVFASAHVDGNNWPGIGYHFSIYPSGKIYQTNWLATQSFHCGVARHPVGQYNNYYSVGVSLVGNFSYTWPTSEAIESAGWLIDWLMHTRLPNVQYVLGHREMPGASTVCPGNVWPEWRDLVHYKNNNLVLHMLNS